MALIDAFTACSANSTSIPQPVLWNRADIFGTAGFVVWRA
jgi:hypothetical protein